MSVEQLARALLYEGYLLYPYRATALKNRQRWSFGALYPPSWPPSWPPSSSPSEPSSLGCELLVRGDGAGEIAVELAFLQLLARAEWQEASERRVAVPPTPLAKLSRMSWPFTCAGGHDGERRWLDLVGRVDLATQPVADGVLKLSISVHNLTATAERERTAALLSALASAHLVVRARGAELVSLLEPPPALAAAAAGCRQIGVWPVLVGAPGQRDTMLASPVVLYDYPRVAPESPGDLFDGGEIDEILSLRILTLSDAEKAELRRSDPQARALLERTEALDEAQLLALHGVLRRAEPVRSGGLHAGARVRLRPRARADIFDLALAGQAATIASVEEDFEGRVHVTVTVDADPGRDLGAAGQPGHRFFFFADEVEPL